MYYLTVTETVQICSSCKIVLFC